MDYSRWDSLYDSDEEARTSERVRREQQASSARAARQRATHLPPPSSPASEQEILKQYSQAFNKRPKAVRTSPAL